jgi:hypothetical protein
VTGHHPSFDAVYLTVIIVSVFAVSLLTSSYAAHRASVNSVSIVQLCKSIDAQRARQVILWEHLIAIEPAPPHETPQARAQRLRFTSAFLAYVERVFAPADCRHPTAPVP